MFYLSFFTNPSRKTRIYWTIRFLIVFYMLFYLANLAITIWPCVPRSRLWMPTEAGHCVNYKAVFIILGTINVVTNSILLILPITQVRRQQMSRRRAIGVSFVFIIGLLYVKPLNSSIDTNCAADKKTTKVRASAASCSSTPTSSAPAVPTKHITSSPPHYGRTSSTSSNPSPRRI